MFTGIVETTGTIVAKKAGDGVTRFDIAAPALTLERGGSIAVNGVCLSAVDTDDGEFAVQAIPETLARTSLGHLNVGDRVNLERPLAASGRFDGHIVQGHVDGTGAVRDITTEGDSRRLWFDIDHALLRYVVEKGSICLDGVSLTVSGVDDDGFEVALIPITLADTTLGALNLGDVVNVEVDIVAKYVERLMR